METGPITPDYSGDSLTLKDIGVDSQLPPTTEPAKELQPNDVVELRAGTEGGNGKKSKEKKKPTAKALFLAGAALLGSAKLAQEAFSEKIHSAPRIVNASELNDAESVEIEDIKPGSSINVSPFSYVVTGGNVRTSPRVEPGLNEEPDTNLVQHADISGKVIAHPIEVADETNPTNGNWYVFFDSDGQKFAINEQNLEAVQDPNITSTTEIEVTVDKTTNMGIIAHDNNNISMQVATVIDANS